MAAALSSDEACEPPSIWGQKWYEDDDADSVSDFNTAETLIINGGDDELSRQFREYAERAAADEKARYDAYQIAKAAETRFAQPVAPSEPVCRM
jgi:hypothetical protein